MLRGFQSDPRLLAHAPEQRAMNLSLAAGAAKLPPPGAIPIDVIRRNRLNGKGGAPKPELDLEARDTSLQGPAGLIPARLFQVEAPLGTYIHVHGGGWVFGSIHEQDRHLRRLAEAARLRVVTIGYRLAPESPCPAGTDDVEAAVLAVAAAYPDAPLLVGGESAGAHLVASAALRLRDRPEVLARVAALNLSYGIYDLSMSPSQRLRRDQRLGLSTPHLEWMIEQFTPSQSAEDRRRAEVSPLFADLGGLPPALFTVGSADILLDDSLFMAARWASCGNATELEVYPEAPHGFNALPTAMAAAANRRIETFLSAHAATRAPHGPGQGVCAVDGSLGDP